MFQLLMTLDLPEKNVSSGWELSLFYFVPSFEIEAAVV